MRQSAAETTESTAQYIAVILNISPFLSSAMQPRCSNVLILMHFLVPYWWTLYMLIVYHVQNVRIGKNKNQTKKPTHQNLIWCWVAIPSKTLPAINLQLIPQPTPWNCTRRAGAFFTRLPSTWHHEGYIVGPQSTCSRKEGQERLSGCGPCMEGTY